MVIKLYEVVRAVRAILRITFVTINNIYCIPTYVVWMVLLRPLLFIDPVLFWWIEGHLFKSLLLMVGGWSITAGFEYVDVGEDVTLCHNQECLIISNHQSTADVPTFMMAFQPKGQVINRMMWIIDRMFKFTNFGIVSYIHGDFFIRSGKSTRDTELDRLRKHMQEVYIGRKRQWIVLFPEGGFLRKRKEVSQRYARKNNLPHLEYVTLPRVGALQTILEVLHPFKLEYNSSRDNAVHSNKKLEPLKWVIDVTIGYPGGEPADLPSTITMLKDAVKVHIYYRKYPIEEVPIDSESLTKWLYDRFVEKEHLLSEFYRTGSFPQPSSSPSHGKVLSEPRKAEFDFAYYIFCNIAFLLSTLFHCWLFRSLWNSFYPVGA